MDYKYIEQLLEQYWECRTSLEEEAILRSFFAQDDVPESLLPYRKMFVAEQESVENVRLDADFDKRMMALINSRDPHQVKARSVSLNSRWRPFYKVAAVLAMVLSVGMAVQQGWESPQAGTVRQQDLQVMDTATVTTFDAATATMDAAADSMKLFIDNNQR